MSHRYGRWKYLRQRSAGCYNRGVRLVTWYRMPCIRIFINTDSTHSEAAIVTTSDTTGMRGPMTADTADPSEQLKALVIDALEDLKAVNLVSIDVRGLTDVMDWMIVASGNSSRHVKSLADNVSVSAKAAGVMPLGVEGMDVGEWVLVDLGDVVAHIMLPATRDFYDLERLWLDPRPSS